MRLVGVVLSQYLEIALVMEVLDEIHRKEELFFRDGTIAPSSFPKLSAFSLSSFVDETLLRRPVGVVPSRYLEIVLHTEVRDEVHGEK